MIPNHQILLNTGLISYYEDRGETLMVRFTIWGMN
jgi:hypothetical protein